MNNNFSICYVIQDSAEFESSFLRGSVYKTETIDAIRHINHLPLSIPELLCTREETIRTRLDSIFHGRIVEIVEKYSDIAALSYTFKVAFVSTPPPESQAASNDILHVSLHKHNERPNLPHFESLTFDDLRSFYFSKVQHKDKLYLDLPDTFISAPLIDPQNTIEVNIFTHGNIATLRSVGILPSQCNRGIITPLSHIEIIEHSIDLINKLKSDINQHYPSRICIPSTDYLITDFSIDLEYSINSKHYTKHSLMKAGTPNYAVVAESIAYARSHTNLDMDHENNLIKDYKKEVYFSSLINSLFASSTLAPEIKIRTSNSEVFPIISDMGLNIRNGNTSKLHKQALRFSNQVISKSDGLLDYISDSFNKHVKIVSNLPIEWTNLNSLPLMIRHNASRVFSTPGSIKEKILLNNREIKLTLKDLSKILVISSFKPGDRISQHMAQEIEKAMRVFKSPEFDAAVQEATRIGAYAPDFDSMIVFRTIKSKDELIKALNEQRYALVIFDMHGGHDSDSQGYLALANGKLYPQELSGTAQIPPIVILSACDTSPADRNHFNVANAFLCAGAVTVLASTYPILSKDAASYISRLYKRIRLYLPERILSQNRSIRWSEFITGLNRRVYFAYFMKHIQKKYKQISKSLIIEIANQVNFILESHPESFLSRITQLFDERAGLSEELILEELAKHFTFAECMNYVQIGCPEKILIHAEDIFYMDDYNYSK